MSPKIWVPFKQQLGNHSICLYMVLCQKNIWQEFLERNFKCIFLVHLFGTPRMLEIITLEVMSRAVALEFIQPLHGEICSMIKQKNNQMQNKIYFQNNICTFCAIN